MLEQEDKVLRMSLWNSSCHILIYVFRTGKDPTFCKLIYENILQLYNVGWFVEGVVGPLVRIVHDRCHYASIKHAVRNMLIQQITLPRV